MKETPDVLERLRSHYDGLSDKFRLLAAFAGEHYRRVAFMSARELAKEAGVSLPTVVRFVARIGFRGYQDFNRAIQERVNLELTGVERLEGVLDQRGPQSLSAEVISREMRALKHLMATFPEKDVNALATRLANAASVVVVGVRYVSVLTTYLAYTLRRLRPGVVSFSGIDSTVYDEVALQPRDTIVVGIGFARYATELVEFLEFVRKRKLEVAVLTDQALSPLATLGDHVLAIPVSPMKFMRPLAAPGAVLNVLVLEVARKLDAKGVDRLETLEEVARERGTYSGGARKDFRELLSGTRLAGRRGKARNGARSR